MPKGYVNNHMKFGSIEFTVWGRPSREKPSPTVRRAFVSAGGCSNTNSWRSTGESKITAKSAAPAPKHTEGELAPFMGVVMEFRKKYGPEISEHFTRALFGGASGPVGNGGIQCPIVGCFEPSAHRPLMMAAMHRALGHDASLYRKALRDFTTDVKNQQGDVATVTPQFVGMIEEFIEQLIARTLPHNSARPFTSQYKNPGTQHPVDPQHPPSP